MPDSSINLSLPYILPSQAQKHVTHNEALAVLDAVVQLVVADRDRSAPPDQVEPGARHIVALAASGPWAGQEGQVAVWMETYWAFLTPRPGWRAWVLAERSELIWQDGAWENMPLPVLDNLDGVGVNTTADAVNRFAVMSDASLFSHTGAGHQLKINKALAADTASLLFQTGWSGRAEMGTAGDDDWSIKVSADGASWTEALRIDAATGLASGTAVQSSTADDTAGRLMMVGAFGLGEQAPDTAQAGISDMNDLVTTGFWTLAGEMDNTPFGTSAATGTCLAIARRFTAGPRVTQLANYRPGGNEQLWYRQGTGDPIVWGDWTRIFTQANIVGTVSQSGGVSTGAIIERGSNANGEYVRFADGTQICWVTANLGSIVAFGSGTFANPYCTASVNLDWPAAFATGTDPQIACNGSVPSASVSRTERLAAGTVRTADRLVARQCTVTRLSSDSTVQDGHIDIIASGRWF